MATCNDATYCYCDGSSGCGCMKPAPNTKHCKTHGNGCHKGCTLPPAPAETSTARVVRRV